MRPQVSLKVVFCPASLTTTSLTGRWLFLRSEPPRGIKFFFHFHLLPDRFCLIRIAGGTWTDYYFIFFSIILHNLDQICLKVHQRPNTMNFLFFFFFSLSLFSLPFSRFLLLCENFGETLYQTWEDRWS